MAMRYDPDITPSDYNLPAVKMYLIERGYTAAGLAVMKTVDVFNAYHTIGLQQPLDVHGAIFATAQALADNSFTRDVIASVVREQLDSLAPRQIEIVTPTGNVLFDQRLHYQTPLIIQVAALGHPIMLVGPAGCGKTTIGEHCAKALQLAFYITGTVTDTHELTGFVDGYGKYHATPFRHAFEGGGVWVADEIDAWEAQPLLAANSALANGYCAFPDSVAPIQRHPNFRMIATANTFGTGADRLYVGRNELDAASLDRFATIDVDYDIELERLFAGDQHEWLQQVWALRKKVMQKRVRHVVSSRAVAMGAAALRAGLDIDDVEQIYLHKGLSTVDREKLDLQ